MALRSIEFENNQLNNLTPVSSVILHGPSCKTTSFHRDWWIQQWMLSHRKWKVLYHQLLWLKAQRSSFFHTCIFHVVMMDRLLLSCWGFTLLLWAISSIFSPVFSGLQHIAKEKNDTHGLEAGEGNEASASLPRCVKTVDTVRPALHSRGDVVIGGIFPLHYSASVSQQKYINKPQLISCSGWDLFTF